jgi:salicylate hydroxylase
MSRVTNGHARLSVIVVGAGIAGLAVATGLAQKGHKVTVLESKPALNEFGASIGILPNGVRVLKSWGLKDEFEKVVTKNGSLEFREGFTNKFLGHNPHNKNNFADTQYDTEIWNINRRDYQETLARAAENNGAKILFNADVIRVDVDRCIAVLKDGRELVADCIIGADGMKSAVRKSIPATAHIEPVVLEEACFRCIVPKEKMRGNPKIEWLLENGNEMLWTAPGKYVLSWPLPSFRDYDVVTCIQRPSDVPAGRWGVRAEADEAREDFQDFCPEIVELLSHISSAVKWTLAELPPLETCRSENGRVVLVGDAFHAQIPHIAMVSLPLIIKPSPANLLGDT